MFQSLINLWKLSCALLSEDEMSLTSKSREFIQRSSVTSDSGWILEEVTQVNNTFNLTTKRYFSSVRYNVSGTISMPSLFFFCFLSNHFNFK